MRKNKVTKRYTVKYALYRGKTFIKNIVFNNVATVENTEIILNNIINNKMPFTNLTAERTTKLCNL